MPHANGMVKEEQGNSKRKQTFWLSVLAGVLLVLASAGAWINNYLFNNQNFSNTVSQSLTSESSRQAIAQGVTNRVFEDRPTLKNTVGDVSTKIVSGLLDTTRAADALGAIASRLQTAVTSSNRQDIAIELGGIKSVLGQLYDVSANLGREPRIDPQEIPDQIVLVSKNNIPNFYVLGVIFLWVAPLALIGALAALAYPYIKNWRRYKTLMMIQGACVAAAGLLALLAGPLFKPLLLGNLPTTEGRTVMGNLYNALVGEFNNYLIWLIAAGLIALAIGTALTAWHTYKSKKT